MRASLRVRQWEWEILELGRWREMSAARDGAKRTGVMPAWYGTGPQRYHGIQKMQVLAEYGRDACGCVHVRLHCMRVLSCARCGAA
eukprot:1652759-Pleurochrysis_carterae.AAC.1